jgi:hypothetical protein
MPADKLAKNKTPVLAPTSGTRAVTGSKPAAFEDPFERRRLAAVQVRSAVAAAFPSADEPRPTVATPKTKKQIAEALEAGAVIWQERPRPDVDNGFIVGFDFGTSAVKLAVRQPYQSGDPVKALDTPTCLQSRVQPHPHLWPSVVWFHPETELFELTPSDGAIALDGFKSGLIAGKDKEPAHSGLAVTRAEASVAFLGLQLAYLLGRYSIARPLGEIGGDHFLSINIGLPVQSMDNKPVVAAFSRVVSAAVGAARRAPQLTLDVVRDRLKSAPPSLPEGFALVPELTAAIAGYAAEPTARSGAHMLVDVGAATLDIVAFNLIERGQRVSVFACDVEMFGAAAMSWAKAGDITDKMFKDACDHQFDTVWSAARDKDPVGFHPANRRVPVSLIKTGGGCATDLHSGFIAEMVKPAVLGEGVIEHPQPPRGISSHKCDLGRLLLAYGLTRDEPELALYRLPSSIPDIQPFVSVWTGPTISKDQV